MTAKFLKMNSSFKILIFSVLLCFFSCIAKASIIVYNNVLSNNANWVVEQQPKGKVSIVNGKMEIIDAKGVTVWFKNKLHGNIKIEYDITIIDNDGPYDRVSDMNCFWMANDPNNLNDFFKESQQRKGHFPNYHHLKLYYVGYGGHHNTKTRFRRYNGNIDRPLLPEHDLSDKRFMITANKKMHIEILTKHNYISYSRDGEIIFKIDDSTPYTSGYFGFRTVNNHMLVENFKVSKLK